MIDALEKIVRQHREKDGNVISLLQDTQEELGYIPREAVNYFSEELGIAPSRFFGVATFYSQFHLNPRGKNIVTACCGTACHVKGSERIINGLMKELNLGTGQETTEDTQFTLDRVNCVGACSIAPVIIINKKVHGKATSEAILKEIRTMKQDNGGKE